MSSRDKILGTVKRNQPEWRELPPLPGTSGSGELPSLPAVGGPGDLPPLPTPAASREDLTSMFITTLEAIGGAVYIVPGFDAIAAIVRERYPDARRIISGLPQLAGIAETPGTIADPHTLDNVDLAILPAHFGVAENGACWVTEEQMIERALPFIAQHLALVFPKNAILVDMHAAYERIAALDAANPYSFATFIAGPSKTADIEQSLVLGAHGPASLTVFLLDEHLG